MGYIPGMFVAKSAPTKEGAKRAKEPLVSVIIPVYNGDRYIEACVQTIINQSYRNLEILVIDDGSTKPGPWDRIRNLDERVTVLFIEHRGVSHARNVGIDNARGEYLFFVDADDFVDSRCIEELLNISFRYDSDIVSCNVGWMSAVNSTIWDKSCKKEKLVFKEDFGPQFWNKYSVSLSNVWGKLFKKEFCRDLRYDESLHYYEDGEYAALAFFQANEMRFTQYIGYYHFYHDDSVCQTASVEKAKAERMNKDKVASEKK